MRALLLLALLLPAEAVAQSFERAKGCVNGACLQMERWADDGWRGPAGWSRADRWREEGWRSAGPPRPRGWAVPRLRDDDDDDDDDRPRRGRRGRDDDDDD